MILNLESGFTIIVEGSSGFVTDLQDTSGFVTVLNLVTEIEPEESQ